MKLQMGASHEATGLTLSKDRLLDEETGSPATPTEREHDARYLGFLVFVLVLSTEAKIVLNICERIARAVHDYQLSWILTTNSGHATWLRNATNARATTSRADESATNTRKSNLIYNG